MGARGTGVRSYPVPSRRPALGQALGGRAWVVPRHERDPAAVARKRQQALRGAPFIAGNAVAGGAGRRRRLLRCVWRRDVGAGGGIGGGQIHSWWTGVVGG